MNTMAWLKSFIPVVPSSPSTRTMHKVAQEKSSCCLLRTDDRFDLKDDSAQLGSEVVTCT